MNWKISLLIAVLWSPWVQAASPEHFATYQRLQRQLELDPKSTLTAIELFLKQVNTGSDDDRRMANYLHLQACTALNRYACAASAADTLVALTEEVNKRQQLRRMAAQLYYQLRQPSAALQRTQEWLSHQPLQPPASKTTLAQMHSLAAYCHFNMEQLPQAIIAQQRAIQSEPTEQRYRFLLALHQQLEQWSEVADILALMVSQYPNNAEYWQKYAYALLKLDHSKQALLVLGSAYKAQRLPQKSIILYAQLLLQFETPNRVITVLEANPTLAQQQNYAPLLAQSYLLARQHEKARQWLASHHHLGSAVTRGLLAYQQGDWQGTIKSLSELELSKKENHYWQLLIAISQFELKRWPQAKEAFSHLSGSDYDEIATQWLSQIAYLNQ